MQRIFPLPIVTNSGEKKLFKVSLQKTQESNDMFKLMKNNKLIMLDSGAEMNVCNSRELFVEGSLEQMDAAVVLADCKSKMKFTGIGSIWLNKEMKVTVDNVLLVYDIINIYLNLLQFDETSGLKLFFSDVVKDEANQKRGAVI